MAQSGWNPNSTQAMNQVEISKVVDWILRMNAGMFLPTKSWQRRTHKETI